MFAPSGDPLKYDTEAVHLLTLEEREELSVSASDSSSFDSIHDHFDPADESKAGLRPATTWRRKALQTLAGTGSSLLRSSHALALSSRSRLPKLAIAILPSFIGSRILPDPEQRNKASAAPRPTAFLDGLRGVAAWAVFNTHLASVLDQNSGSAWGHDGDPTTYKLSKLPIVRLIYDGRVAVCIFFVISGFALSLGPVSSMNKADSSSAFRRLCSATFRRPVRLFLPAFASTFIIFTFVRFNVFMTIRDQIHEHQVVRGWEYLDEFPKPMGTWWGQLIDLYRNDLRLIQIFNDIGGSGFDDHYNDVLWTIAIEFRASLMLFLSHAALAYIRRPLRIVLVVFLILVSLQAWSFEMPLFWAGLLLAELWSPPRSAPSPLPQSVAPDGTENPRAAFDSLPRYRRYGRVAALVGSRAFAWTCFFVGAFLASIPGYEPDKTPLWAWLVDVPRFGYFFPGFWTALGSVMIVFSISWLPVLCGRFCLSSPPIVYLGKISFSLYLVHISFVRGIGSLIYFWAYSTFGESNSVDSGVSFIVGYAILLSMTIWAADLFCRLVEQPSMRLAKWLESKAFKNE